VEFRQPAGTTNPDMVVAYVLLYLRLVEISRRKRAAGSSWQDLIQLCSADMVLCDWLEKRRAELAGSS
jgi:hypothetical protein